jgi:hypothetical protein
MRGGTVGDGRGGSGWRRVTVDGRAGLTALAVPVCCARGVGPSLAGCMGSAGCYGRAAVVAAGVW